MSRSLRLLLVVCLLGCHHDFPDSYTDAFLDQASAGDGAADLTVPELFFLEPGGATGGDRSASPVGLRFVPLAGGLGASWGAQF